MLRLDLSPGAVGRTHFGYSPLSEVASSARVLLSPRPPVMLQPWVRETRARLGGDGLRMVAALIPAPPRHLAPVFFFQRSGRATATIEEQLEQVRRLPAHRVRAEIVASWRSAPPHSADMGSLAATPDLPEKVAELAWRYWQVAIAPYWPRMSAVISGDVSHRTSRLALSGLTDTINDLHPTVRADETHIQVDKPYVNVVLTRGHPVLLPTIFVWPGLAAVHDREGRFDLIYAAHGVARVWESLGAVGDDYDTLAGLVGRGRASILVTLDVAKSTTQLAHELRLSPATVSEHLGILRRSRLVTGHRRGHAVYYQRTDLAEILMRA